MKIAKMIGLSEAVLGHEEQMAVAKVLESGWLTQGEHVGRFEAEFSLAHQMPYGVAVCSCTAGLHLALAALGIKDGDEVLVPAITFAATANAVFYVNAKPVAVDASDFNNPHMSLEHAKKLINQNTRAVICMHYGGSYMDMQAWSQFARDYNLFIIEDAAHCPGLKNVGQYSDAAVYSFFGNKNMTTGEGGMILTSNSTLADSCRSLRGHAMSAPTLVRAKGHAFSYTINKLGWNYRMDEIHAAIGIEQLKKLPEFNEKRAKLARLYRTVLRNYPDILTPFTDETPSVNHLFTILLPKGADRQRVMQEMRENGIQTSIHYPLWTNFEWHKRQLGEQKVQSAKEYFERTLTLPLHPKLELDQVPYIIEHLAKTVESLF